MSEEDEVAVGEYVLGTLPAHERARFAERLARDAALQAGVRAWQERLVPLAEIAATETPSPSVWRAIDSAIGGSGSAVGALAPASNVVQLKRRLAVWRRAAFAAGALAAALAVVVALDLLSVAPAPAGGRYVAVVDSEGHEPALIAEVDTNTGLIRVRRLAAETPTGHSLELWHVAEGHEPRSLGILDTELEAQTIPDLAATGPASGIIAVSVEPEGGSPSGAPTGDILYTGELIPIE